MDVEGAVAIVTGGASGIGSSVVRRPAERGAIVNVASVAAFEGQIGQAAVQGQPREGRPLPQAARRPDELASVVVEAITNSCLNAETLRVDGGIRMQPK